MAEGVYTAAAVAQLAAEKAYRYADRGGRTGHRRRHQQRSRPLIGGLAVAAATRRNLD